MDRISPNFMYAIILKISTSFTSIFAYLYQSYGPLFTQISFLLNILRTNGQILTKLHITIYTDKISLGLLAVIF